MASKTPTAEQGISPVTIEEEMRRSYLDYAMSVIVSRALPDVCDGMKPVQRRILYAMQESGYLWNRPYRKSARIIGEVMGKYHPHGDKSIYDALTRMTQDFSLRLPLIDGQGNFGSVDGDPPAAMRYTEARLARICEYLLDDLGRDTVDFVTNYDGSEREPAVLPAALPNLLINGAGGIAVGMATNIPPHNPEEIVDACLLLVHNPGAADEQISEIVKGPDFPTGALIMGQAGIRSAQAEGRGSVVMRAKTRMEEARGRTSIIVDELPYQVNKATMIEKIAEMVKERRIEGISALRDESDRDGIRVVIELKRDAEEQIILNQLWRNTPMQTTFGVNMVALKEGRPLLLNLREMLEAFVAFRQEVVRRRTRFELAKAQARAHILSGLYIAVVNIDKVIALIRAAANGEEAKASLMERDWPGKEVRSVLALAADPRYQVSEKGTYRLSEEQAKAILDLRLQKLTALGLEEITKEMEEIQQRIEGYFAILRDHKKLMRVIARELTSLRAGLKSPRRTEITAAADEMDAEDLIQEEDMVVTVSHNGYIKRVPLVIYRSQKRGGKGRTGMKIRETDFAETLFIATTHTPVLFFSSAGKVYQMKIWRLPQGQPQTRGKAMINLLPLAEGERITSVMPLTGTAADWEKLHVMFATRGGNVRRNQLADFIRVNRGGKIAMKLDKDDTIIGVGICREGEEDVLLTTRKGQCIRFPVEDVRVFAGRSSTGVRGVRLSKGDEVIGMSLISHITASPRVRESYIRQAAAARRIISGRPEDEEDENEAATSVKPLASKRYEAMRQAEQFILAVSEKGYGKRTSSYAYRITKRGGKGITAMTINERNGEIVASFPVAADDQIMLITDAGQLIRCPVNDIRIAARGTQGVKIFNTGDKVVSVAQVNEMPDSENGSRNGE